MSLDVASYTIVLDRKWQWKTVGTKLGTQKRRGRLSRNVTLRNRFKEKFGDQ